MLQEEEEKGPNSNSNKDDMKAWLKKNNIDFDDDMLKAELWALCLLHRKKKIPAIEKLLRGTLHEFMWLPPYHAIYNPIELVWGLVKRYFDAHVGRDNDYSHKAMIKFFHEALDTVTPAVWARICDKVEKRIFDAYDAEVLVDDNFQMIISLEGDDDDDSDDEGDDEWETVEKSVEIGTAEEQDIDDPAPLPSGTFSPGSKLILSTSHHEPTIACSYSTHSFQQFIFRSNCKCEEDQGHQRYSYKTPYAVSVRGW